MLPETNYYLSTNNLNEGTVIVAPAIHLFALGEAGYAGRNLFKPADAGYVAGSSASRMKLFRAMPDFGATTPSSKLSLLP